MHKSTGKISYNRILDVIKAIYSYIAE